MYLVDSYLSDDLVAVVLSGVEVIYSFFFTPDAPAA
jgi:hypothetical protein